MSTYLFEITNSNSVNNQEQNVTGKFGTGTGSTFQGAFCNAGTLCVANGNLPIEGYESIVDSNGNPKYLNGRSFYMNVAADGTGVNNYATGIYACNTYDVNKATDAQGNSYNVGGSELGLGIPAGTRETFTQIFLGETYSFGYNNFSTAPGEGVRTGYATIANGFLVYSATKPTAGTGLYFEFSQMRPVTAGTFYEGDKYPLTARMI